MSINGSTPNVSSTAPQQSASRRQTHHHHHHHKKASASAGGGNQTSATPDPTATSSAADAAPQSPISSLMSMLSSMLPGGGSGALDTTNAPASNGQLNIAQIDDFSTDRTGFNHGQEIAKTLNPDGSTNLMQFNIAGGGDRTQNISNALDSVLAKVKSGQRVDAVEIPQVDANDNATTQAIRAKIEQLTQAGVPVILAAGNNGPGQHNFLETNSSFNVENTVNGRVSSQSGQGNVKAEGRTTSFASANLALQVARLKAQGESVGQIFSQLA